MSQHLEGGGGLWGKGHYSRGQTRLRLDGGRGATWQREGLFLGAYGLGAQGRGKEL